MEQPNDENMQRIYKAIIDFARYSPAVFMALLLAGAMTASAWFFWLKIERVEDKSEAKVLAISKDCSERITEVRAELRHCVAQKDTLIRLCTAQAVELAEVKAGQRRIERRIRTAPAFGVRE